MAQIARTPGSVITAAVIMFVYGGLLLICGACGGIFTGVGMAAQGPDHLGLQAALDKEAPGHQIVSMGNIALNILFALTFIGAGLGVFWLSQIARFAAYGACAGILLSTIALQTYQIVIVMPVTDRIVQEQLRIGGPGQAGAPAGMGAAMAAGKVVGLLLAFGIPLAFCTPIVILLTVKSARDAFAGRFASEAIEEDRSPRRYSGYDDDYPASKPPQFPGDTGIKE
ncbi:MAG: hypothetical protein HY289_16330 [Planctomycetes bacterium]|nr:hypothetical protein [Planctomycetota bacterium]